MRDIGSGNGWADIVLAFACDFLIVGLCPLIIDRASMISGGEGVDLGEVLGSGLRRHDVESIGGIYNRGRCAVCSIELCRGFNE